MFAGFVRRLSCVLAASMFASGALAQSGALDPDDVLPPGAVLASADKVHDADDVLLPRYRAGARVGRGADDVLPPRYARPTKVAHDGDGVLPPRVPQKNAKRLPAAKDPDALLVPSFTRHSPYAPVPFDRDSPLSPELLP